MPDVPLSPDACNVCGSTIVKVIGVNKVPLIDPDTLNEPVTLFGPVTDEVNIPLAEYTVDVYAPSDPVMTIVCPVFIFNALLNLSFNCTNNGVTAPDTTFNTDAVTNE